MRILCVSACMRVQVEVGQLRQRWQDFRPPIMQPPHGLPLSTRLNVWFPVRLNPPLPASAGQRRRAAIGKGGPGCTQTRVHSGASRRGGVTIPTAEGSWKCVGRGTRPTAAKSDDVTEITCVHTVFGRTILFYPIIQRPNGAPAGCVWLSGWKMCTVYL